MIEGAEVRLTADFLKKKLENKIIVDWTIINNQYKNKNPRGFNDFYKNLPLIVEEVSCKGKLIYFTVYNEINKFYILHNLRTTGSWQTKQDEYCRWCIVLDDDTKVWFRNPKYLATIQFISEEYIFKEMINRIGPDILSEQFTLKIWRNLIKTHKNKNITSFLTNQYIISGCGNYIKCEALYESKISPKRKVGTLTENESEKLFQWLRIIPRIAYNKKGYENDLKIYKKGFATYEKTADGRMTYWDPEIQE